VFKNKLIFWFIVEALIIVTILIWVTTSNAETFGTCVAKCKFDVMYIDDCIEEERAYWETDVSEKILRNSCIDLIRNERLDCYSECAKQEVAIYNSAIDYWEMDVKNFPNINY